MEDPVTRTTELDGFIDECLAYGEEAIALLEQLPVNVLAEFSGIARHVVAIKCGDQFVAVDRSDLAQLERLLAVGPEMAVDDVVRWSAQKWNSGLQKFEFDRSLAVSGRVERCQQDLAIFPAIAD
jgi:hypothetical protein